MPIYEFYCPDCHTVFSFLATRVDTQKQPDCPRCSRRELERRASRFALGRTRKDGADDSPDPQNMPSEASLERIMHLLEREGAAIDESNPDPRQAGRLMRKLYETAGLDLPPGMHEALRRLEAGEDPEAVEAELGDSIDAEAMFDAAMLAKPSKTRREPARDETLYDL